MTRYVQLNTILSPFLPHPKRFCAHTSMESCRKKRACAAPNDSQNFKETILIRKSFETYYCILISYVSRPWLFVKSHDYLSISEIFASCGLPATMEQYSRSEHARSIWFSSRFGDISVSGACMSMVTVVAASASHLSEVTVNVRFRKHSRSWPVVEGRHSHSEHARSIRFLSLLGVSISGFRMSTPTLIVVAAGVSAPVEASHSSLPSPSTTKWTF